MILLDIARQIRQIFIAFVAHAAATGGSGTGGTALPPLTNPISCGTFSCVGDKVIGFLQIIAIPLLTIMVLWGGIQLMTSGGNEEKAKNGKNILLYAVIGFAIVLVATGIEGVIKSLL